MQFTFFYNEFKKKQAALPPKEFGVRAPKDVLSSRYVFLALQYVPVIPTKPATACFGTRIPVYWSLVITRCAETGLVPPARGVMVSAVDSPAGFRTVRIELMTDVCTRAIPTISEVPVARPTTV